MIIKSCVTVTFHCVWHTPQIQSSGGDVTITNDGATILKQMRVLHPVARMVRPLYAYREVYVYVCVCADLWLVSAYMVTLVLH